MLVLFNEQAVCKKGTKTVKGLLNQQENGHSHVRRQLLSCLKNRSKRWWELISGIVMW